MHVHVLDVLCIYMIAVLDLTLCHFGNPENQKFSEFRNFRPGCSGQFSVPEMAQIGGEKFTEYTKHFSPHQSIEISGSFDRTGGGSSRPSGPS